MKPWYRMMVTDLVKFVFSRGCISKGNCRAEQFPIFLYEREEMLMACRVRVTEIKIHVLVNDPEGSRKL